MRSSLGAPHSTERCKITNFSQRTQIFTTFSIIQTSKSRYTTTTTTKTCKFTVHTTPLPTGEGLGWGFVGLCVFLPSYPRLRIQAVLHFTQLELKDIILCHRAQTLTCRHLLSALNIDRTQIAIY